ncbi:MAG: hypothetical protein HN704_13755 [Bacteroidetes bacterium]|jgi:hypothetical protein|nr:hypothetical protein [Bacteroidota bacterium]MBT6686875.1 hypothetical protein [Bacteroidota bacterium]MBT7143006.1 hypothetical protein [Bacteroidota bacterium]MBT7492661.1 hypothetical protein [Bacteroidota bacterium]
MNKKYLSIVPVLLFISLLLPLLSHAQTEIEDVLYLKNGGVIRGQIIEHKINEHVKIKCSDRNIWVFEQSEIDRIAKEEIPKLQKYKVKDKGYVNNTDFGLLINNNDYFEVPLNFLMVNAYKFPFNTTLGIGTGIERFNFPVIPLFLDAKYYVFDKKVSPVFMLQSGYSFSFEKDRDDFETKGGYMFNLGCGVRVFTSNSTAWLFSISYMYQELETIENYYWDNSEIKTKYFLNSINIRIGFYFQ